MMNVFVFGMGYSSLATARALQTQSGDKLSIEGTTRSADKIATLSLANIVGHQFSGTEQSPTATSALSNASHVIHSIAPNAQGDPVLTHYAKQLAASDRLEWLCYFSTVGVYGNFEGAWVDETSPCHPANKRSQWRVTAEQNWRALAASIGVPLAIFRLAGIYGPGRSTFDKLKAGTSRRIIKPGQVFNRIHVEDIGRVTALAAQTKLNGTFNLSDDEPAPPQDVILHAAKKLDMAPPKEMPFESAEMTPMARSFYADNKRVSNAAIKRALGIELLYPSYRQGLEAIKI